MTRHSTYRFDDRSRSSNYIRRVRPAGTGFKDATDADVPIEHGDILMKLPDGPWFAQFRDLPPKDDKAPANTTDEPTAPAPDSPTSDPSASTSEAPADAPDPANL